MSFLSACVKSLTHAIISLVPMPMKGSHSYQPRYLQRYQILYRQWTVANLVLLVQFSQQLSLLLFIVFYIQHCEHQNIFTVAFPLFPFTDTENGAHICFIPFWFTCYLCSAFFLIGSSSVYSSQDCDSRQYILGFFCRCCFAFFLLSYSVFFHVQYYLFPDS